MKQIRLYIIISLWLIVHAATSQEVVLEKLTFDEVIYLARNQSPDALLAKHKFRGNYWEFRTYKAEFKPNLSLNAVLPDFNREIKKYQNADGAYSYVEDNMNSSTLNLNLRQNVGLTGGQVFASSSLTRLDVFGSNNSISYLSSPLRIGYRQPVLFYNEYKWQKKIEPLKYEEAKKKYISSLEELSIKAVNYFYDLALAQQNKQVAQINLSNADTLFQIARERYNFGTISENQLMQMKLNTLNAGSFLSSAIVDLEIKKFQLRSFLGIGENFEIQLIISKGIPNLTIDVKQAIEIARTNNPDIVAFERQIIETERNIAKAKSEKGLQIDLYASFGYSQRSENLSDVYVNPQDQQRFVLSLNIPILDWGLSKGKFKMAQSSQEVIRTTVKQSRTDFVQNIILNVMQFNLQNEQVMIASQKDAITQKRYDMSKQQYITGKIDVLDLNVALSEKDLAKTNYISALHKYWSYFYNLRKITLFDFINNEKLKLNFREAIQ